MRAASPCGWCGMLSVGVAVVVMGCEASPDSGVAQPIGSAVAPGPDAPAGPDGAEAGGAVQALRLDDMNTERADPTPERRNPFRFGAATQGPSGAVPPVGAPAPPPVRREPLDRADTAAGSPRDTAATASAIPLTFMGFMESPGVEGRVVVLSDGDAVFHGRRGDVIDGRYRILDMGLESVELERIDGRGRATLSLPNDLSDGL